MANMDEKTLERFLPALGDRIALRNYCGNGNQARESRKLNLLEKLRKKMKLRNPSRSSLDDSGEEEERAFRKVPLHGNKNASKDTRRIELGWIHNKKQVRTRCGGGTRKVLVKKTDGYEDLIKLGKELFFPEGQSKKGPLANFIFQIYDFQESEMPHDVNIGQLYESVKLGVLRFYLVTVDREESEASSEDVESPDAPPESNDDCYITSMTSLSSDDEIQFGPVDDPNYGSKDTLPVDETQADISFLSPDEAHVEAFETDISRPSPEEAHAQQGVAQKALRLHRVNIVADMVEQFKDASLMDTNLSVTFVNESGIDASGVARDAYSCFWESLFVNCADGEEEYVPALQPEYGREEWEAIGRILLKAYKDHGFFPIKLSLAFTVCLIHGENQVSTEMLIESFLR